jgi:YD repeat-containing protein
VSAPFTCNTAGGCSSSVGTNTTYDALGRLYQVTDANLGTTTHTYSAQAGLIDLSVLTPTPSGDQSTNGKTRASLYNSLGELVDVCEVNTYSDASACNLGTGTNGYLTSYTYDAMGHLLTAAQGVQNRRYYYDGLGRMTQELNPENGTTTYTFDSDTTHCNGFTNYAGDLASIVRQSGSSTCFNFDKLHRQITAADSDSFAVGYVWDTVTITGINGGNPVGQNGKIAEAYTCNDSVCATGVVTNEAFTYDKRGLLSWYYQTSPNAAGWYTVQEAYDSVGNMSLLNFSSPAVLNITIGAYDAEGRPTEVDTSGSPLAKSASYGLFGLGSVTYGSGDYDSFSYDLLGHMTRYKYNVGANYYEGDLQWNSNGTLATLKTTDTIPVTVGEADIPPRIITTI